MTPQQTDASRSEPIVTQSRIRRLSPRNRSSTVARLREQAEQLRQDQDVHNQHEEQFATPAVTPDPVEKTTTPLERPAVDVKKLIRSAHRRQQKIQATIEQKNAAERADGDNSQAASVQPLTTTAGRLPERYSAKSISASTSAVAATELSDTDVVVTQAAQSSPAGQSQPLAAAETKVRHRSRKRNSKSVLENLPVVRIATQPAKSGRLRDGRKKKKGRSYPFLLEPPLETENYGEWFQRVVMKNKLATWFTTFYVHWLLILTLALIVVHGADSTAALLITATFSSEEELAPGPPIEVTTQKLELAPTVDEDAPPLAEEPATVFEERDIAISDSVLEGLKLQPDDQPTSPPPNRNPRPQDPPQYFNPAPPDAVTQGSFSVWAEPRSPKIGEPYRIFVQIRLPDDVTEYDWSDLQGMIVGSDGYRKPIPPVRQGSIAVQNGFVRFSVAVVSADQAVNDTIYVRSKLLKETQELRLQF